MLIAPDPVACRDSMRKCGRFVLGYLLLVGIVLIGVVVHFAPQIDAWGM